MLKFKILVSLMLAGIFLTACEQNQPSKSLPTQSVAKQYEKATTLQGTITAEKGALENGVLDVTDVNGKIMVSTSLENSKNYRVEVPAGMALPVLLRFSPEHGEKMVAVVIHASISKYDINAMTTRIAEKAKAMGGYTDGNLRQAAEMLSSMSDNGKATAGAHGNPTQRYGGWH